MIASQLTRLQQPRELTGAEVRHIFDVLIDPRTSDAERVALLVALRARPETVGELTSFAREMRRRAVLFDPPGAKSAVDVCGSGGAPHRSFNVSTGSAFVVAAAGQPVAKHGNRSSRGPCGSSDLLEALGLPVLTSRRFAKESFRRYRIAFLHAPLFHPATRAVVPARRLLGAPTIFNRLGPLVNPARVRYQVVGVGDLPTAERLPRVLRSLGVRRGLAVTSDEGSDEFSPSRGSTTIAWNGGSLQRSRVIAKQYLPPEDRRGSWSPLEPAAAAEETERILAGGDGARRGSVLLTSGAALLVSGRAPDMAGGVDLARNALDSGAAESLLGSLRGLAASRSWPVEG